MFSRITLALLSLGACATPGPMVRSEAARIAHIEEGLVPAVVLKGREGPGRSLGERMAHFGVTSASVAFLDAGRPVWSRSYGPARATLPAAGAAATVAAIVALRLEKDGKLPRAEPRDLVGVPALVERATGERFTDVAARLVFQPLGMSSTRLAGGALETTASDLARLAAELIRAGDNLSTLVPAELLAVPGLGVAVSGDGAARVARISGGGSVVHLILEAGQGVVVLADGDGGAALADEIVRSVAVEYAWPGAYQPVEKEVAAVDAKSYDAYVGRYVVAPGYEVAVARRGERLVLESPGGDAAELYPEAEGRFFLLDRDATVSFERDAQGVVRGLVAHVDGRDVRARRL